jgi:hypothetical protein
MTVDAIQQTTELSQAVLANFRSPQSVAQATAIAKDGSFSDIPAITKKLAIVDQVARANQLIGQGGLRSEPSRTSSVCWQGRMLSPRSGGRTFAPYGTDHAACGAC